MELKGAINDIWNKGGALDGDKKKIIFKAIESLDKGLIRVVEFEGDDIKVNDWVKKAILLYFKSSDMTQFEDPPFNYYDKIGLKADFKSLNVRAVPGAIARYGSYIEPGVILMPSFVNIGAWVGADTMVDTWATVGSCAYIGKRVHLSGGVGIGGVLEPPNSRPVVIEDDVMIGSRAMITEGAWVKKGSVIGAGTILNPSIPVIDAQTGEEISKGIVPPNCVAVSASRKRSFGSNEFFLPCVLIIKHLEKGKRHDKAQINEILRAQETAL
jgi:2,3,4,5-tetrahydropyridine-2-carboxylate N-succinyltransferase